MKSRAKGSAGGKNSLWSSGDEGDRNDEQRERAGICMQIDRRALRAAPAHNIGGEKEVLNVAMPVNDASLRAAATKGPILEIEQGRVTAAAGARASVPDEGAS
jgi:hypothetical protein